MGTSRRHEELVVAIVSWLKQNHPEAGTISISADSVLDDTLPNPPSFSGHIPDVYAVGLGSGCTIIGEAKTERDLETTRSRDQLRAFLSHLSHCPSGMLVIGTPWGSVRNAKGIIRAIKRQLARNDVEVIFLERLIV